MHRFCIIAPVVFAVAFFVTRCVAPALALTYVGIIAQGTELGAYWGLHAWELLSWTVFTIEVPVFAINMRKPFRNWKPQPGPGQLRHHHRDLLLSRESTPVDYPIFLEMFPECKPHEGWKTDPNEIVIVDILDGPKIQFARLPEDCVESVKAGKARAMVMPEYKVERGQGDVEIVNSTTLHITNVFQEDVDKLQSWMDEFWEFDEANEDAERAVSGTRAATEVERKGKKENVGWEQLDLDKVNDDILKGKDGT